MRDRKFRICADQDLLEKDFRIVPLTYKGKALSGIIFRYNEQIYAYLNQCVHMPHRLNAESDTIFDETKKLLRCSMHGMLYQLETGESISTRCNGARLQKIRLKIYNGHIYIDDKRVNAAAKNHTTQQS